MSRNLVLRVTFAYNIWRKILGGTYLLLLSRQTRSAGRSLIASSWSTWQRRGHVHHRVLSRQGLLTTALSCDHQGVYAWYARCPLYQCRCCSCHVALGSPRGREKRWQTLKVEQHDRAVPWPSKTC